VNDHQKMALENHCRFAFECAHPRFAWLSVRGKCSIVLTVNSGWE
jgi:hypothetical protein